VKEATLGILAGTGFYDLGIFDDKEEVELETEHGKPSGPYEIGNYHGKGVAFLPRHGKRHTIPPHRVNHRANVLGFQQLGVKWVIGINSMGSLKPDIKPPCIAIPDDYVSFFDIPTYYDEGDVKHATPGLDPFLRKTMLEAASSLDIPVHDGGAAVQTRGPRFETPAEIRVLARWGELVGMNMASEATLCNELELPFANIASIDNYGNGIGGEVPSFELVLANSKHNREKLRAIIKTAIERLLA